MIDPRHPYPYQHAARPTAAAKAGLSPGLIAVLVIGGAGVLGIGAVGVAGAVWYLAAQRPDRAIQAESTTDGGATAVSESAGESDAQALPADPPERQAPASPTAGSERPTASHASEAETSEDGSRAGQGSAGSPETPAPSGPSWWCTASASVRVCGFAGACNYQMVFGNGSGKDRFLASQQAKNACQASARAKGATAVCIVQCSAR
jgi:hypothetical protein